MRRLVLIGVLFLIALSAAQASSTFYVGFGANTPCAVPGMAGCLTDPVSTGVLSSTFSVYQTGNQSLTSPLLLIIGVAGVNDPNLFSSNSIVGLRDYNPYNPPVTPGPSHPSSDWSYGSTAFNLPGYTGYFTGTGTTRWDGQPSLSGGKNPKPQTVNDVYDYLYLSASSTNSQNRSNWDAGLNNVGYPHALPTGYGIYTFELRNVKLNQKGLVDITFATKKTVPHYSYVFAYGLDNGSPMSTPFTKTALQYPEPSSLILLSTAGLLLIGSRKYRAARSI